MRELRLFLLFFFTSVQAMFPPLERQPGLSSLASGDDMTKFGGYNRLGLPEAEPGEEGEVEAGGAVSWRERIQLYLLAGWWGGRAELLLESLPVRPQEDAEAELMPRERVQLTHCIHGAIAELASAITLAREDDNSDCPFSQLLRGGGFCEASAQLASRLRQTSVAAWRLGRILHFVQEQHLDLDPATRATACHAVRLVEQDRESFQAVAHAVDQLLERRLVLAKEALDDLTGQDGSI